MNGWNDLLDDDAGYLNLVDEYHYVKCPIVLGDRTSVLFPRGWTPEDVHLWRKEARLERPTGLAIPYRKLN